ncbi:hypothetical protein M378DRAFT_174103 [Amanita muscaria Koide BX008]|uniref:Protein kinase domain-containing protein n=1 Tax=Amanita muscaria (strain Koide BX008) TaxID=946122 RepID=A0A0C2WDR4_AMAMK|nr:hypothetical protein M378DRAFT_174103 [Amanita muscaria Koide BX008]
MAHEYLGGFFKAKDIETSSDTMSDLTDQIECTTEFIGRGGFGCVYKGRWVEEAAQVNAVRPLIVVKVMNLPPPIDEEQKNRQSKQIKRELDVWSKIDHKNILSLLGIAYIKPDTNIPAFISAWMENGNAKQFRLRNPSFPPLRMLHDIIQGLHYLHTFEPDPIVHGDIKAVNVLINDQYEARLCDFGLSRFLIDSTLWRTTATQAGGSLRWMSPELMTGKQCTPTKESDIYAYAMTCYEILSGDVPFKSVRNEANLIHNVIIEKQRPEHAESCGLDDMWDIITKCWAEEPEDRPRTAKVLELVRKRTPPHPLLFLKESDERPVLTKSTNRRYLSVSKILESEDERIVEGSLIEPTSRRYLNVNKVLEN